MRVLTSQDILTAIDYLINLEFDIGSTDDIDHLGNRRVRSLGELLQNQVRVGSKPPRTDYPGTDDCFGCRFFESGFFGEPETVGGGD